VCCRSGNEEVAVVSEGMRGEEEVVVARERMRTDKHNIRRRGFKNLGEKGFAVACKIDGGK